MMGELLVNFSEVEDSLNFFAGVKSKFDDLVLKKGHWIPDLLGIGFFQRVYFSQIVEESLLGKVQIV